MARLSFRIAIHHSVGLEFVQGFLAVWGRSIIISKQLSLVAAAVGTHIRTL